MDLFDGSPDGLAPPTSLAAQPRPAASGQAVAADRTARGRDRSHGGPPRRRRVSLRLDEAEFAALAQAARAARLTPSGYLAQLLQDSSGAAAVGGREPLRQVVAGLVEATVAVAGLAAGLDAGLGGHGVPPGRVEAVLDRLDDATLAALAELRRLRPAGVRR